MGLTKKDISIGSGKLYIDAYNPATGIPADATIEVEAKRLGDIVGGASVVYEPTFYTAKDDLGRVSKTVLTDEKLTLKSGLITWNSDTLNKLACTGEVVEEMVEGVKTGRVTFDLGGIGDPEAASYVIRFVHSSGKQRVTIVGSNQAGFTLGFQKDKETSIDAEFLAEPMSHTGAEGRLMIYEDTKGLN